ncbi:MAG: hypothetical protein FWC97_10405 [Treponema sp.]|nr:hypothetical protein [Treponema sp.]
MKRERFMKRLFILFLVVFATVLISCDDGSAMLVVIENETFPAPIIIESNFLSTELNVMFTPVNMAYDYMIYVIVNNQVILLPNRNLSFISFNNAFVFGITRFDFDNFLQDHFMPSGTPTRVGVRAVSVDGVMSSITWANLN